MSYLVYGMMLGWPLAALVLFFMLPARRALIATYLGAWLFLPIAVLDAPFLNYSKDVAASAAALAGIVLVARPSRIRAHLHWVDLPIVAWCVAPALSSFSNDLGAYDMAAATVARAFTWGVPYLLGRLWLADRDGLRELGVGVFASGLVYAPLCLYEIRMSPQLHRILYGWHQHGFEQTIRLAGTFRPMVFMHHGLMLGLWMASATLIGFALWRSGTLRRFFGVPIGVCAVALCAVTILCQSFGALILLAVGSTILFGPDRMRRIAVLALVVLPIAYSTARIAGIWNGREVVDLVERVSPDRAYSLEYRLEQEQILSEHAWKQSAFGWGGFGRQFPERSEPGAREIVGDSLWVIAFGQNGLFGLASVLACLAVPILVWMRRCRARAWNRSAAVAGSALAIVLGLFAVDSVVNAMFNPLFLLAAGALAGMVERPSLVERELPPEAQRTSEPSRARRQRRVIAGAHER